MREILFRGKLRDGRWAEGNLEVKKYFVCIITPDDTPLGCYGQVDPDTVGQYTGLTDKNGTKIFEGDVVRLEDGETGAVIFRDAGFALDNSGCSFCVSSQCERLVIGNIHDNPELLEARHAE